MPEQVSARTAERRSLRADRRHEEVFQSLWFIPLCCALGAWALSRLTLQVDVSLDESTALTGLNANRDAYGTLAGAVAAAMLTFLGVVFSTTIVAVQLAASQYSPRVVRLFVRSRLTQLTLGVFLATFVFALSSMFRVESNDREFVPALTLSGLVLLVAATVLMFVAYVHGIVRLLRVQYLLRSTAASCHDALDLAFPEGPAYHAADAPTPAAAPRPVRHGADHHRRLGRGSPRVLQAVDIGGLAAAAATTDCWVELRVPVGTHAAPRTTIAVVHAADGSGLTDDEVLAHLLFGSERTLIQDPGFGFRQLVDVACRALSPAVNDPTTGVQALERVVDLLERIADRPDPTGWYTDEAGVVRVRLVEDDFDRLARLGVLEIIRYGADAPQVTRAMLASLDELADLVPDDRRPVVDQLRSQALEAIELAMPAPFTADSRHPDRRGLG